MYRASAPSELTRPKPRGVPASLAVLEDPGWEEILRWAEGFSRRMEITEADLDRVDRHRKG
ncbi:MAG TPA: hypothetical protein DEQ28_04440 [Clostridiales bacterium]|nr:hypothetical protein [Clostridiales bacterium]